MTRNSYITQIAELSESEGVFTTAQAERLGIPRDALHDAYASGRLERVKRGAYRLVGSGAAEEDAVAAAWKLTDPARFTWERSAPAAWDGVCVGGATAACLLGIGDFYLTPCRMYAPRRRSSRDPSVSFGTRLVERDEASFERGFPVTRAERTIADLVLDSEDPSLVEDALRDAVTRVQGFDLALLRDTLARACDSKRGSGEYGALLKDAGIE